VFCFVIVVVVVLVVLATAGRGMEVVVCSVVVVLDTVSELQPGSKAAPVTRTAPIRRRLGDVLVTLFDSFRSWSLGMNNLLAGADGPAGALPHADPLDAADARRSQSDRRLPRNALHK
jgi:hypothetical protein